MNDQVISLGWRITVNGTSYDTRSLTLAEAKRVEALTGKSWLDAEPRHAADLEALIGVFLARTMHLDDLAELMDALTLGDIRVELLAEPEV